MKTKKRRKEIKLTDKKRKKGNNKIKRDIEESFLTS